MAKAIWAHFAIPTWFGSSNIWTQKDLLRLQIPLLVTKLHSKKPVPMTGPGMYIYVHYISQTDFGMMNWDFYFIFIALQLCVWMQKDSRNGWQGAGTAYPGHRNKLVMLKGHQMDLTSLKTSSCIFIHCILLGRRAKLLELHHYFTLSHPFLLAIKVSIFIALFCDSLKVPMPPGLDQHLPILHLQGGEEDVNLVEMHKDAAMIIN